MNARHAPTAAPDPDIIGRIRYAYRLAKSAESMRNGLAAGVMDYVRKYVTGWTEAPDKAARDRASAAAARVVKHALRDGRPLRQDGKPACPLPKVLRGIPALEPGDERIAAQAGFMVPALVEPWWTFERANHDHRSEAETLVRTLPVWRNLPKIAGFNITSAWGLVVIIGEVGDTLTDYSMPEAEREEGKRYGGVRRIYKRLGLAPDEAYPQGEKRTGRKIPRATRGRIMGVICDPLLRQQWRGERKDEGACHNARESQGTSVRPVIPAHAIGPFGEVYGRTKVAALASGKTKLHAEKLARRAMVKALVHDVHRAWHGKELHYQVAESVAAE